MCGPLEGQGWKGSARLLPPLLATQQPKASTMSDTIPDLTGGSPPSDAPPPSSVAELIRAGAPTTSYDGLGTEPPSSVTDEESTTSVGGSIPDTNYAGPGEQVDPTAEEIPVEPIVEGISWDGPLEDEATSGGILLRQLRAWSEDQLGSYTRTIDFNDPGDHTAVTIYYQNYQPFLVEIRDNEGDSSLISAQTLGHITVLAQQFANGYLVEQGRLAGMKRSF